MNNETPTDALRIEILNRLEVIAFNLDCIHSAGVSYDDVRFLINICRQALQPVSDEGRKAAWTWLKDIVEDHGLNDAYLETIRTALTAAKTGE